LLRDKIKKAMKIQNERLRTFFGIAYLTMIFASPVVTAFLHSYRHKPGMGVGLMREIKFDVFLAITSLILLLYLLILIIDKYIVWKKKKK